MRELPLAVRRLWRGAALLGGFGVLLLGLIAVGALDFGGRQVGLAWLLPPLLGLLVAGLGWLLADVRYRSWRFGLDGHAIEAKWGVITRHHAVVPRNRVQTVTTEDGPIDRFLDLTTLTVHTAGARTPNLTIPHLESESVEWIRQELARGH